MNSNNSSSTTDTEDSILTTLTAMAVLIDCDILRSPFTDDEVFLAPQGRKDDCYYIARDLPALGIEHHIGESLRTYLREEMIDRLRNCRDQEDHAYYAARLTKFPLEGVAELLVECLREVPPEERGRGHIWWSDVLNKIAGPATRKAVS